ncbi:MAG: hypothetical protein K2I56_06440 [Muribaculaceae bacterium]|nr:hypothetical protein [Muribaculaceae bacterium]
MEENLIQAWYEALTGYLRRKAQEQRTVVVVALSRKMPRLITWIKEHKLTESQRDELEALLASDSCIYTTEHGLPFVFSDRSLEQSDALILDDIIITSETLRAVSDEIQYLTGRRPDYLSLYAYKRNENVKLPHGSISDELPLIISNIKEARRKARDLAAIVARDCLPVDIEFPICHIGGDGKALYNQFVEGLRQKYSEDRYYTTGDSENPNFTVIINSDASRLYNNDFSKLRVFSHAGDLQLVCYSPNMFSESRLQSDDIFENAEYRRIWTTFARQHTISDPVTSASETIVNDNDIRLHRVSQRLYNSLTVLVNYMLSLSTMIREKENTGLAGMSGACIRPYDLQLIVGSRLAPSLAAEFNRLYNDNITSTSRRTRIELPDCVTPENYAVTYRMLTSLVLYTSETPTQVVEGIFNRGYSLKNSQNNRPDNNIHRVRSGYYLETFESLYGRPRRMMRSPEGKLEINRAIDRLIDGGYVVPLYYFVEKEKDSYYWRRFFRASHPIYEMDAEE